MVPFLFDIPDCFITTKLQRDCKSEGLMGLNDSDNYSLRPSALRRWTIAAQQPDVPAHTDMYQMRCTAYKVAPDDGLI